MNIYCGTENRKTKKKKIGKYVKANNIIPNLLMEENKRLHFM